MKLVVDRHKDVIAAIYAAEMKHPAQRARAEEHGVTLELMQRYYAGAVVVGLEHGNEIIGGMIFHDGEVHIGILKPLRGRWYAWLQPMLELGFAAFGPRLVALVNKKNRGALNFTRRVGGVLVGVSNINYRFEIHRERMIYGRN
jgi:hypothetical protein